METIVSIMPFPFQDNKPGLTPGDFQLRKGSPQIPSMLVVKEAKIRMMDQNFKYFPMDVDLGLVAADVCNGYNQAQIGYGPDAMPGLFHVKGEYTNVDQLKKDHAAAIATADKRQRNWFEILVKIADDDWAVTPQHRVISDLQRLAARYLNMQRAWVDADVATNQRCPACMTVVSDAAAVCFACKAILDKAKYDRINFATA